MKKILFLLLFLFMANISHAKEIKTLNSSEFLSLITSEKEKIIIVNFFATWCPPCIIEIPDFVKIREEYPHSELTIIALSVDEDHNALENFMKDSIINYPVYKASEELTFAYRVSSIPHTIIYSKDLKQIYNKANILNYRQLKSIIELNK